MLVVLLQTTTPETTAAGGQTVILDPGQVQQIAEYSQGNTYALLGMLFIIAMLLAMIFLNTLLR